MRPWPLIPGEPLRAGEAWNPSLGAGTVGCTRIFGSQTPGPLVSQNGIPDSRTPGLAERTIPFGGRVAAPVPEHMLPSRSALASLPGPWTNSVRCYHVPTRKRGPAGGERAGVAGAKVQWRVPLGVGPGRGS